MTYFEVNVTNYQTITFKFKSWPDIDIWSFLEMSCWNISV